MADTEDRTQAASERRVQQARDEGQAPVSRELVVAAGLGSSLLVLMFLGPPTAMDLGVRLRDMLSAAPATAGAGMARAAEAWLMAAGPMLAIVAISGMATVLLQSGFLIHGAALMPEIGRLDPRRGLRRVFGLTNAYEALKSLGKMGVLGWAVWSAFHAVWPRLPSAALWTPGMLMQQLGRELIHLLMVVVACQGGIALLDVAWSRWRFGQKLRMSREDLKQEHREAEGDPKVKARLRQLRLLRGRRRMLAAVSKATVVVTNPTHYAIALSYQRGTQSAPRVVAKGVDSMAARIRGAAEKSGVPLVANAPLARALYSVPLDAEVPAEHFKLVAEIIAYVWRLRSPAVRESRSG